MDKRRINFQRVMTYQTQEGVWGVNMGAEGFSSMEEAQKFALEMAQQALAPKPEDDEERVTPIPEWLKDEFKDLS